MNTNQAESKEQRAERQKSLWGAVPEKVRAYFKSRGSRAKLIWPRQIFSEAQGWIDVAFASPKLHRKNGPFAFENQSWPADVRHIQFTDGSIFADFYRSELCSAEALTSGSGVAA